MADKISISYQRERWRQRTDGYQKDRVLKWYTKSEQVHCSLLSQLSPSNTGDGNRFVRPKKLVLFFH